MKWLPARPTVYKGIRMRSRLEADFARWLDSPDCSWLEGFREFGARWDYEPLCFAGPYGQYLPDFRIDNGPSEPDQPELGRYSYIEVKPVVASEHPDFTRDPIEDFLVGLETIWFSDPGANLKLVFWTYGAKVPYLVIEADGWYDRLWKLWIPGMPWQFGPLLWPGRSQWFDLWDLRASQKLAVKR